MEEEPDNSADAQMINEHLTVAEHNAKQNAKLNSAALEMAKVAEKLNYHQQNKIRDDDDEDEAEENRKPDQSETVVQAGLNSRKG